MCRVSPCDQLAPQSGRTKGEHLLPQPRRALLLLRLSVGAVGGRRPLLLCCQVGSEALLPPLHLGLSRPQSLLGGDLFPVRTVNMKHLGQQMRPTTSPRSSSSDPSCVAAGKATDGSRESPPM